MECAWKILVTSAALENRRRLAAWIADLPMVRPQLEELSIGGILKFALECKILSDEVRRRRGLSFRDVSFELCADLGRALGWFEGCCW